MGDHLLSLDMTAQVLPFPLARRRSLVQRNAARVAESQPKTAEKIVSHAVQVQIYTMSRRGIAPEVIAREALAYEAAIRHELWRLIIGEGDGAA
jgi:hypothetical protein